MKICMYSIDAVAQRNTGGVKRFIELMNAFKSEGYAVELFSPDTECAMSEMGIAGYQFEQSDTDDRKFVGVKSILGNKAVFHEIKKRKFDRVIVFDVRAAISLAMNNVPHICLFLRQDMIAYKEIQYSDKKINPFKKKVLLTGALVSEAICLKRAEKIVVQCQHDLDKLLERHRILGNSMKNKCFIQINNINPSWNKEDEFREITNKKYDVSFIGNFRDSRKGHDVLLAALKEITDAGMEIRAAIIGDGYQLQQYENMYKSYSNIEFLGRLKNPMTVVMSSRLLIVPSYEDSCPNTVMEGLFYKIPVIGSNRGGIPEILNKKDWLVEMNAESIAQTIKFYLDDINNKKLKANQQVRRNELLFDWGKKMIDIVIS